MSGIEERLARDIAAVTGGVVVTDSDLRDARFAVDESTRQGDRRRSVVAAVAAVAAAVLITVLGVTAFQTLGGDDKTAPPANPGPSSPSDVDADFLTGKALTPDLIDGLWRVDNDTKLWLFNNDGTMRFDYGGMLYSNPSMTGAYEIDGDLITVTTTSSSQPHCIGTAFAMRASLTEVGAMRFAPAWSSSSGCTPMRQRMRWVLEQVLPTNNESLRGFKAPATGDWQPPAGPPSLYGDWMAEVTDPMRAANGGGGHVLELAPDRTYIVATADRSGVTVVDRGRWNLSGSKLSLVSAGDSPTCDQGDRLVLGGVQHLVQGTTAMRATVEQNGCGSAWAPAKWFLLPHKGREAGSKG